MFELKSGDKVAIVAPSAQIGGFEAIEKAIAYLQDLGLKPVFGKSLYAQNRYMAGKDEDRAADVNEAFSNDEIKAVFCVRAAAGATRILPYIDYETATANRKPIIGFCDNAALMLALWKRSGIISLNGFLLTYDFKNGAPTDLVDRQFKRLIKGENLVLESGVCLNGGKTEGVLLPVNLSVLMRLAGTPYFPELDGAVLVLEDVHERVHKIDLMLQQLKQQPNFDKLKGLIFGQWTDCSGDDEDGSVDDCINDFMKGINVPVLKDFNFGHTPERLILPLGVRAELNADKAQLKVLAD